MTAHIPQEQISAWLDNQLGIEEAEEVRLHLRQCEDCRLFEEELASTQRLFQDLEALEPPPYLWTRIAAGLESPARDRFGLPRWRETWRVRRREVLALAGVLLVMVGSAVFAVLERRAARSSELAVIALIDHAHASLAAKNSELYNPFRVSYWPDPDSNPFSRGRVDANSNPFLSLRERR